VNASQLRRWARRVKRRREYALSSKYRAATMIAPEAFVDNLLLCATAPTGVIAECGSWRGGMSAAMAEARPGSTSYLFDSFEGLPPIGDLDGERTHAAYVAAGTNLEAPESAAVEAMRRSGSTDFHVVKGWFSDTLPSVAAEAPKIAILRLDGDWYDSTMVALAHLFPLVVADGLVIIDDYGTWDGCTRAVHDYLSREGRHESIHRTAYGVPFLRKGEGY
jgi:O-methyltransferase